MNKALALAGICSRRSADALILAGQVEVNGQMVVRPGTCIDPGRDRIVVQGRPVPLVEPGSLRHLYLALHKPAGVVTTFRDPQGRTTVLDLLPPDLKLRRPFPVGRLDRMSEGLLLMSTDGDLALRLTHPRHEHVKVYRVHVRGRASPAKLETMRSGMRLAEGDRLAPVQVRLLGRSGRDSWLEMVLGQGVNRQVRRMCRDLRLHVVRLIRIQQGPVRLGDLPPGAWRHLRDGEISAIQ